MNENTIQTIQNKTSSHDPDFSDIMKIVGDHPKFPKDPDGYYIWYDFSPETDIDIIMRRKNIYLQRLSYAVSHADELIHSALEDHLDEFYNFYGVKRDIIKSPAEFYDKLVFGSFVLEYKNYGETENRIAAALENTEFMFGHFIECAWNTDWKPLYSLIC